ncbi:MAG: hypothetical protein ABIO05_08775 [Ferruginibacter sp.]
MKIFLVILFLLGAHTVFAQLQTNVIFIKQSSLPAADAIYYSPAYLLNWSDFKGTPAEGKAAAITASGFGYRSDISTVGNSGKLNVSVYCFFNKGKSWVKPGRTTPYILNHEQHHFNISFIAANLFVQKIKSTVFTVTNFKELLPKIYTESLALMNNMQVEYDGETKNGQLKDVQGKWDLLLQAKVMQLTK